MVKPFRGLRTHNKQGIVLFITLATIFIVIILSNIMLSIMSSQSRLTRHQVGRIQAYYAAAAGMNYALEKLRIGTDANWPQPNPDSFYTHRLCDSTQAGCVIGAGDIDEQNLPNSVQSVTIVVADRDAPATVNGNPVPGCNPCNPPAGVDICICNTATYTFTP